MKKLLTFMFCICAASMSYAQLKVSSAGKVAVGTTATPQSAFSIGCAGESIAKSVIEGNKIVLKINSLGNMPASTGMMGTGILVNSSINSVNGDIGIESNVVSDTPLTDGTAVGILGQAGNANSGYNYGVIGNLEGNNDGTGVFGSVGGWDGFEVVGRYAGFFDGDVYTTGVINGTLVNNSDRRYKENIEDVNDALTTISRLVPVKYNYKRPDFYKNDSVSQRRRLASKNHPLEKKKHYGLIAQDVQKIYPDLVYENSKGYLSINYTEMIPILVQSIKELNDRVKYLSERCSYYEGGKQTRGDGNDSEAYSANTQMFSEAILYQNNPNPFTHQTKIRFRLPQDISDAYIYIFNMQGVMLKQIEINSSQDSITIDGSEFGAGMYLYSLIINGKEIDTKRMILSK